MARDVLRTIEELLEAVQEDVASPEATYKLRTARQLLSILEQRNEDINLAGSVEILRELHVRHIIRRDEGPPEVADSPVY